MPSERPAMRRSKNDRTADRKAQIRCAIYTRKSSEEGLEQNFNSLDAQRESCEAFIRSQMIPAPINYRIRDALDGLFHSPRRFPDTQGKYREFSRFRGLSATMHSRNAMYSWVFLVEFPTQPNREIFRRNRELIRWNREFL